ncbi:MAG: hypothetical protein KC419_17370 [Anaerolineales bacterium]|nr:hypothetical protein [Anaerolineales bacterium]MCA9930259.1 hypothetical protein [Anaerolineales bacterium]
MSKHPDIHISAADLWAGATAEHAKQVVLQLQRDGYRAFHVSTPSDADIGSFVALVDAFWAAMLEVAETAVNEAARQQNAGALRLLQRAQETHNQIMQQQDEAQAVLQAAAARLQELDTINGRLQELGQAITQMQEPSP